MTTATIQKWWHTAAAPTCQPWCQGEHEPDEFTRGGFLCVRVVLKTDLVRVDLQQYSEAGTSPNEITTRPPEIWFDVLGLESHPMTLDDACELTMDINMATAKARAIANGKHTP